MMVLCQEYLKKYVFTFDTYWPSTEPSIKRYTCVNKQKQVYVKQKYNQDTDGLCQLEIGCQRSENQLQTEGLGNPAKMRKKCCYGQKNFGSVCSSLFRLQLTSHTQPTSTLWRIKCERYIFIKKCVRSFIKVVIIFWLWLVGWFLCLMAYQLFLD